MSLTTVDSISVCADHAHLVEGHDAMARLVDSRQAESVALNQAVAGAHLCGCGKPAFWRLRAVKIAPGHYTEATIELRPAERGKFPGATYAR